MTDAEKENLINLLDSLVMAAVPKASKVTKYGGTLYTLKPEEKETATKRPLGCMEIAIGSYGKVCEIRPFF